MSSIDDQINMLERKKKRARTISEKQRIDTQINKLKAQKRSGVGVGGGRGEDPRKFGILNQNKQIPLPKEKPFERLPFEERQRIRRQNVSATPSEEISASRKRTQAIPEKLRNDMQYGGPQDRMPLKPDRSRLEDALLSAPEDRNIMEQFVSKLLGRDIRFEDIPDDDPDFKQGDGSIEYPAGRPDLRMGGMTARSAATTKFKKPLGMKGGGAISNAERRRIARIMQDYKQKKARKSNGKRTSR